MVIQIWSKLMICCAHTSHCFIANIYLLDVCYKETVICYLNTNNQTLSESVRIQNAQTPKNVQKRKITLKKKKTKTLNEADEKTNLI